MRKLFLNMLLVCYVFVIPVLISSETIAYDIVLDGTDSARISSVPDYLPVLGLWILTNIAIACCFILLSLLSSLLFDEYTGLLRFLVSNSYGRKEKKARVKRDKLKEKQIKLIVHRLSYPEGSGSFYMDLSDHEEIRVGLEECPKYREIAYKTLKNSSMHSSDAIRALRYGGKELIQKRREVKAQLQKSVIDTSKVERPSQTGHPFQINHS